MSHAEYLTHTCLNEVFSSLYGVFGNQYGIFGGYAGLGNTLVS